MAMECYGYNRTRTRGILSQTEKVSEPDEREGEIEMKEEPGKRFKLKCSFTRLEDSRDCSSKQNKGKKVIRGKEKRRKETDADSDMQKSA
ncbi:hypothetical protein BDV12DRAFT_1751 [Aspergillus spectabilis]